MSDWRRFELHPWDATRSRKYGYATRYNDGWVVVEPTLHGGTIHAIWHVLAGNPICWRVAEGGTYAEVMRQADKWIKEVERRKLEDETVLC